MSEDARQRLTAALTGRYRLERELGAGGMATVYLAQDERHDRPVALKVLKPELAAVMGSDRFLTEIRTTANLQHPHILALFDSGEADGFLYYVMPFVEGETLRDLLDREKQLPVDEAVRIAKAVASALDYAHRQGVVHRDIKPANILLQDGQPVVADFGIALAVQQAGGGRLTETGLSLGTPYYMSPEQATADRDPGPRSDVYSLGCVLYEMLAGEPPFQGGTAQAVLGRILTGETPSVTEVRKSVPRHVEAAIKKALQRLPADRFASASDFATALDQAGWDASPAAARKSGTERAPTVWIPWAVALVTSLLLLVKLLVPTLPEGEDPGVVRSVLELPEGTFLPRVTLSISADGRHVAVPALRDGESVILTRPLDGLDFHFVPGSQGRGDPALSPDGSRLLFTQGPRMQWIPVSGGPPQVLSDGGQQSMGPWVDGDMIYFTQHYRAGLSRVRADGTGREDLTQPDESRNELAHWLPQPLPDGRHVLYTIFRTPIDSAELAVLDLDEGTSKVVLRGGVHGRYVRTGHMLYARNNALLAVPFDASALEVTGTPRVVVDDLAMDNVNGLGGYDISEDGTLIYIPSSDFDAPRNLVWVDRDGSWEKLLDESGGYADPALSPDGRRLALAITEPGEASDVWVLDLSRNALNRITSGGGSDFAPAWAGNSRDLVFIRETPVFDLFTRPADGSRPGELLVGDPYDKYPIRDHDGAMTYTWSIVPQNAAMSVSLDGNRTVDTLFFGVSSLANPSISPDGRWIAYTSAESGLDEIYVSDYPDVTRGRRQVTSGGGREPRWTKGGRELVFRSQGSFQAVPIDPDTGEPGAPELLFEDEYFWRDMSSRGYDVTPDGSRFVAVRIPGDRLPRRLVLVTNFFQELREIQPD